LNPEKTSNVTYPSTNLKLNAWEGTCRMEMADNGVIDITTGTAAWWGCALEMNLGEGENLTDFGNGHLNFEIKGTTNATFNIGFQTGIFATGNQVNNQVTFEPGKKYSISENWSAYSIPVSELNNGGNLADVTVPLFLRGDKNFDGKHIYIKNIYYSR
jgi:hypothetical protein